jgi:hypothetical protein
LTEDELNRLTSLWSVSARTAELVASLTRLHGTSSHETDAEWQAWLDRVREDLELYEQVRDDFRMVPTLVSPDDLPLLAARIEQDSIVAEAVARRLAGKPAAAAQRVRSKLDRLSGLLSVAHGLNNS